MILVKFTLLVIGLYLYGFLCEQRPHHVAAVWAVFLAILLIGCVL